MNIMNTYVHVKTFKSSSIFYFFTLLRLPSNFLPIQAMRYNLYKEINKIRESMTSKYII